MMAVLAAPGRQCDRRERVLGEDEMSNAKTVQVSLDLPQSAISALRQDPTSFVGEMLCCCASGMLCS
jgi:hypothetical protein